MDAIPVGKLVWFDPLTERVELHALTEAEMVDRLDESVSVSALPESEAASASGPKQMSLLELL